MKDILQQYAQSTGLIINYTKSSMIPINVDTATASSIAELIGCQIAKMPFTYLGLPLGTTKPTVQELMPLVDRIERKVSASFMLMSYSGRVTLINSLLTSIASFSMCALQLHPKILELVEKIRRHCLWLKKGENGEKKSNSLASWDMVCQPKKKGGLGILNLKIQNQGLLLKYLHKFYNREDTPWVNLIWSTYYTNEIPHAASLCGSFWWKDICKLMPIYRGIASSTVNEGTTTLFWKDSWISNIVSETYPRAFSFAINEDISVQEFLSSVRLGDLFHLPLSPEAMNELRELQNDTRHIILSQQHDEWTYEWGSKFTSSKFYNFCFREISPHVTYGWLWKSKCVPKMKFFGWLVLSDRLNTRNMLRRRHYCLNTGYNCLMCINPPEETIEHLLFYCPFSTLCWEKIGMSWHSNSERRTLIQKGKDQWQKPMYMEIMLISAWNIWKERNNLLFKGINPSIESWKQRVKTDLLLLIHRTKEKLHSFILDFAEKI
jgi:hypothetical protein